MFILHIGFVGGIAKFLKDIEDDDIEMMTSEELRVYSQFVRRCEDDTDIESGNEIWEDMPLIKNPKNPKNQKIQKTQKK